MPRRHSHSSNAKEVACSKCGEASHLESRCPYYLYYKDLCIYNGDEISRLKEQMKALVDQLNLKDIELKKKPKPSIDAWHYPTSEISSLTDSNEKLKCRLRDANKLLREKEELLDKTKQDKDSEIEELKALKVREIMLEDDPLAKLSPLKDKIKTLQGQLFAKECENKKLTKLIKENEERPNKMSHDIEICHLPTKIEKLPSLKVDEIPFKSVQLTNLTYLTEKIKALENQLLAKDIEFEKTSELVLFYENMLKKKDESIDQIKEKEDVKIHALESEIRTLKSQLSIKDVELKLSIERIDYQDKTIKRNDKLISELTMNREKELKTKDLKNRINTLNELLFDKDSELKKTGELLGDNEKMLIDKERMLKKKCELIEKMNRDMDQKSCDLNNEIMTLKHRLDIADKMLNEKDELVEEMEEHMEEKIYHLANEIKALKLRLSDADMLLKKKDEKTKDVLLKMIEWLIENAEMTEQALDEAVNTIHDLL